MDFKQINELIRSFDGTDLTELDYSKDGTRLILRKGQPVGIVPPAAIYEPTVSIAPAAPVQASAPIAPAETAAAAPKAKRTDGHIVTSPLVGTVYLSPAPDKDPFVKIGTRVKDGDILCIVEAMKLMNEIPGHCNGVITEILVASGEMVEYGQELFCIV